MAKSSRHLSEHDRAERRRRDREHLQRAAKELLSSDGWARWVLVRAMFHSYSAHNCMLLATQCHERGIVPTRIAGFRTWLKLGRCVRKGEVALRILAPVSLKERDRLTGEETDEPRVFFKTAFVFDVSQTEIRDGAEPAELEPPHQPLTGDSHAHLLAPLQTFAESLGYSVSFETIDGSAGGWCDPQLKRIVVDANVPANAQLRTLIHETAHALGVDYVRYSRAQAEVSRRARDGLQAAGVSAGALATVQRPRARHRRARRREVQGRHQGHRRRQRDDTGQGRRLIILHRQIHNI
jgi:hypothetical protein